MAFPGGITPLVCFDASQIAYSDLAQTAVAGYPLGSVWSIPSPSPISGNWTATSAQERPTRSAAGTVACEPIAPDYPAHAAQALNGPAGSGTLITSNSCTLALLFRAFKLNNGPRNVVFSTYGQNIGFELGGSGIGIRNTSPLWSPNFVLGKDLGGISDGDSGEGNLTCIVVRFSPTGVDIYCDEAGTVHTDALVATQTLVGLGDFFIGLPGGQAGNAMLAYAEAINGVVTDPQRLSIVSDLKARGCAPMFPATQPLVGVIGDSISVPFGATVPLAWPYRMLASVRATAPATQLLNTSISGSAVSPLVGANSTQYVTQRNHLAAARDKQVVVLQQVTNAIIGDPSNAGVDATVAAQYALADALHGAGAKIVIATCLDRSGLLGGNTLLAVRAGIARYNAAILATGLAHCSAIADLASVVAMQDSTNLTYYFDGVHPTDAGHALLEPVYTAAVLPLLKGPAWPTTNAWPTVVNWPH